MDKIKLCIPRGGGSVIKLFALSFSSLLRRGGEKMVRETKVVMKLTEEKNERDFFFFLFFF